VASSSGYFDSNATPLKVFLAMGHERYSRALDGLARGTLIDAFDFLQTDDVGARNP